MQKLIRVAACALSFIALAPSAAAAQTRTAETVVTAADPRARQFGEEYGFSDAVIAGDLIFLSGIVAGLRPGETDLSAAYDRAYRHIGSVLKRAGASFDDVVDVTSYHTELPTQIGAMSAVQKKYLKAPYPAWTAIDVDRLLPDGGLTEIKIVARRPAGAR